MRGPVGSRERGSTLPLILVFFIVAMLMVAGSVALGQAFVQQRDLQSICDGAAAAAAASAGDLDREGGVGSGESLRFGDVRSVVAAYLGRDPDRRAVSVRARLSAGGTRVTLTCRQRRDLPLGGLFGRAHVDHTATSTARAALSG